MILRFSPLIMLMICALTLPTSADNQALKELWSYPIPKHLPLTLTPDQSGRPYLYIAQKSGGILILQEKGNNAPILAATVPSKKLGNMHVTHLVSRGRYLYAGLGDFFSKNKHAGFAIIDVTRPAIPEVISVWKSATATHGVSKILIHGRHAYLCAMSAGVIVLEISQPQKIRHLSTFLPDIHWPRKTPNKVGHPNARSGVIKGSLLYLAYDAGGIRVINISNPNQLIEVGRYINIRMTGKQQAYNNLLIHGNTLYAGIDYAGLEVLNISTPRKIRQVAWWNPWQAGTMKNLWFNSPGHINELALHGNRLYLSAGDSEVLTLNISTPAKPHLIKKFGAPKNQLGTWGVKLGNGKIYATYIRTIIPFKGTWSGIKCLQP